MARDHGRIKTAIWRDEDWRDLSVDAQWLYEALITQEALSRCGTIDWRPGRLSSLAKGMTIARLDKAARELERTHYLIIDRKTEELFVRSHARHDGVLDRINMGKAVGRALTLVISLKVRQAIITELGRLYEERPTAAGWTGISELFPDEMTRIQAASSSMTLAMP